MKEKYGKIIEIDSKNNNAQLIYIPITDEYMWQIGITRIKDGEVGDKVRLVYIETGSSGLWFGKKIS